MKQVIAPVISNNKVASDFYLTWLDSSEIAAEARPGQFVMVRCGQGTLLPRPLSIHQIEDNKLALLFAVVGKGTRWLSQRRAGDSVAMFGPLGNGFDISPDSRKLLLMAGGMGIAPLYFLAQEALSRGCAVTLLYGTADEQRYPEDALPSEINLVAATEDGTVGYRGMLTDLLPDFAGWADQVFACGPLAMYQDMAAKYPQLRDKPVQVSLELTMGCGRGLCYGCTIKTKSGLKKVCQDGPVFDLDDILWDELDYL